MNARTAVEGMTIYNITAKTMYFYNGTAWAAY